MSVAPPDPKGPPLNALRAFEAAARLGGFSAAAQALSVSPGAIAAHIKVLERYVGAPLFERHAKGVQLSALGQDVLPPLQTAFDALTDAVRQMRAHAQYSSVHIATLPAIAQLWLAPRMAGLRTLLPHIALSITAMEHPPERKRSPYDLHLFFSEQRLGTVLSDDEVFPVCAPALSARLQEPADLAQLPCLVDSVWSEDWAQWLALALPKQHPLPKLRGPVFSLYSLAVHEAIAGAGVLPAHACLIQPWLDSGALVAPFSQRLKRASPLRVWSAHGGHTNKGVAQVVQALSQGDMVQPTQTLMAATEPTRLRNSNF